MANTVNVPVQFKRTSISGKVPNTTNIPLAGEPAINMADGIMYVSTGSDVFPVGANNVNLNVSNTANLNIIAANGTIGVDGQVLTSNGSGVYWATKVGYSGSVGYTGSFGYTGSIGYTGSQGLTGYAGSFGYTGSLGYTGSIGYTGSTGYVGSRGIYSTKITSNTNLVVDTSYLIDTTSGPVTVTLPANPQYGDFVVFTDGYDWSINNVTVLRNGNPIAGDNTQDVTITTKGITVWFAYNGGTEGWAVTANLGPTGYTGSAGLSGAPGGPNTAVQFNGSGSLVGSSAFTFNASTNTVTIDNLAIASNTISVVDDSIGSNITLLLASATSSNNIYLHTGDFFAVNSSSIGYPGRANFWPNMLYAGRNGFYAYGITAPITYDPFSTASLSNFSVTQYNQSNGAGPMYGSMIYCLQTHRYNSGYYTRPGITVPSLNFANSTYDYSAGGIAQGEVTITSDGLNTISIGGDQSPMANAASSPGDQTLAVARADGTANNVAGVNFFIRGSQGTGSNTSGGMVIIQTSPPGASGNAINASVNAVIVDTTLSVKTSNNITANGYVKTSANTVSNLPLASSAGAGARSFVTDATSTTFLAQVVGGGSNRVPVVSNGSVWVIG